MNEPTDIILVLRPLPCAVPVPIRVRQALKTLLRRDRLKCVRIDGDGLGAGEPTSGPPVPADAPGAG